MNRIKRMDKAVYLWKQRTGNAVRKPNDDGKFRKALKYMREKPYGSKEGV